MRICFFIFSVFIFLACSSHKKEAAILTDELNQQQVELLQSSLANLINTETIIISKKAFVGSSEIVIERQAQQGINSNVILGRDYSMPQHFKLWIDSNQCQIEHIESGKIKNIKGIQCIAKEN